MILYENITEEAFGLAIDLAREKLKLRDLEDICTKSGAEPYDEKRVRIMYLNEPYLVDLRSGEIVQEGNGELLPLRDRIIILHYLVDAKGTPFTGKLLTYAQIEGGRFYFPVFHKRTIEPMIRNFAQNPESLISASKKFGGERERYGDASVSFKPLPRIKLFMVVWKGDSEVPPNGNILFDRNITDYLCAEDIAVITEILTWKVIRSKP